MRHILPALCCLLSATGLLPAQPKEPPPTRLVLTPAKAPVPSLRFSLLPELREQTPGNAAPLYRKAGKLLDMVPREVSDLANQLEQVPLSEWPRDEVRRALAPYKEALELLHQGARRERCDFGIAQRFRDEDFATLLPEAADLRRGAFLLALQMRLELAEDRPEQALRTVQTLYVLARHIGDEPAPLCPLVGIAIAMQANKGLELVLCHPRTPNLFWSLAALPHPFIDLRRALEGERLGVCGSFPGLLEVVNNPDSGPMKPEQIARVADALHTLALYSLGEVQLRQILQGGGPDVIGPILRALKVPSGGRLVNRVLLGTHIRDRHETAKNALVAAGRPREQVERWSHMQVALLHAVLENDRLLDELRRWQSVPHWQSAEALQALLQKVREVRPRGPDAPAIPLAPLLLPIWERSLLAQPKLDRQLAALRHIEALRLYAANHGGKLPQRLADIQEVPLPVCPLTGKSFEYRLEGERAILSAPPATTFAGRAVEPLRYEISLRKSESNRKDKP